MDPYEILGVPRNCSRKVAKAAFRARVRTAHPDRGGDIPEFIRLRQAYEQIMKNLDRAGTAPDEFPERPPEMARSHRPADPNWDPEFVVRDEPLPRVEPPHPPDPNWKADFVLDDETAGAQHGGAAGSAARDHYFRSVRRISDRSGLGAPAANQERNDLAGLLVLGVVLLLTCLAAYWALTSEAGPPGETAGRPALLPPPP
jgi:curved DNA-binding protein CbpA